MLPYHPPRLQMNSIDEEVKRVTQDSLCLCFHLNNKRRYIGSRECVEQDRDAVLCLLLPDVTVHPALSLQQLGLGQKSLCVRGRQKGGQRIVEKWLCVCAHQVCLFCYVWISVIMVCLCVFVCVCVGVCVSACVRVCAVERENEAIF